MEIHSDKAFTLPHIRFQLSIPIIPTLLPPMPLAIFATRVKQTLLWGELAHPPPPHEDFIRSAPFPYFHLVLLFHRYHILSSHSRLSSPNDRVYKQAERSRRSLGVWSLFPARRIWSPKSTKGCEVYDRNTRWAHHLLVNGSFFTRLTSNTPEIVSFPRYTSFP